MLTQSNAVEGGGQDGKAHRFPWPVGHPHRSSTAVESVEKQRGLYVAECPDHRRSVCPVSPPTLALPLGGDFCGSGGCLEPHRRSEAAGTPLARPQHVPPGLRAPWTRSPPLQGFSALFPSEPFTLQRAGGRCRAQSLHHSLELVEHLSHEHKAFVSNERGKCS